MRMMVRAMAFLAAGLLTSSFVPPDAWAQPKLPEDAAKKDETDAAPKVKVERGRGGQKVYRITTGFVIEGRIQKPNAFYVLQRSQINYGWEALKKDFTSRIINAVRKSPF